MLKCYVLLGLSLVGCGRESETEEKKAQRALAVVHADSTGQQNLQVAIGNPARLQLTRSLHSRPKSRGPKAGRLFGSRFQPVVAAMTVETLIAENTALASAPILEEQSPAGSTTAGLDDAVLLRGFLASGLGPAQVFTVRPGRDTLLLGSQGTQVFVPADAWKLAVGSGLVRLQMQEFYSIADFVLAGLNTTASGRLLETGGMLNLDASTADGQPVALRNGAVLNIRMPAKEVKPDMQLFMGQRTGEHIDWHAADSLVAGLSFGVDDLYNRREKTRHGYWSYLTTEALYKWPVYLGNSWQQQHRLNRSAHYPRQTIAQLRNKLALSAQEREFLNLYNRFAKEYKKPQAVRIAELEFRVDTTGATLLPRVRAGYDPELVAPVLAAIQKWQRWKPAHFAWKQENYRRSNSISSYKYSLQTNAVGVVRVMLLTTGEMLVGPPDWDAYETLEVIEKEVAKRKMQKYRVRIAGTVNALSGAKRPTSGDLYYELSSMSMGWINCDRFVRSSQPQVTFKFPTGNVQNAQYALVFRGDRTIINGQAQANGQVNFGQLPLATEGTIIAMHWKQGNAFLATQPVKISATPLVETLQYRAVTISELQTALSRLE